MTLSTPTRLICALLLVALAEPALQAQGTGIITTVAGNGTPGSSGDGGPATSAQLGSAGLAIAPDNQGNLYILDASNNHIRKVNSAGTIDTIGGGGAGALVDGAPATSVSQIPGTGVATGNGGNLYVCGASVVWRIDTGGILHLIAGTPLGPGFSGDGGPASSAKISCSNLALDGAGNIYLSDIFNNHIRKIDTSGIITTVAGNGTAGYSGDGGLAIKAQLNLPQGLAADGAGNLYFADNVFYIRKVDTSGIITTVAGNGSPISISEGVPATSTGMNPTYVAVDGAGNLFISDTGTNRVREVNSAGMIHTVAGGITNFNLGDGGPATSASLQNPRDVIVDNSGNLYIGDEFHYRVRKVTGIAAAKGTAPSVSSAVNAASFAAKSSLVQGSLATLFGAGLAASTAEASAIPLPVSLADVSVTIAGVAAPLVFVSSTQINLQVPWTLQSGTAPVVVTVNGAVSAAFQATVGGLAPGIFTTQFGVGPAIAINPDGSLAAPAGSIPGVATRPTKVGDTIIILATGLGLVTPPIVTGAASSDQVRRTIIMPDVLIGGVTADVKFSGLSPQFVGVNQLNVVVPNVPSGVVPLQIDDLGHDSSDKVTIAVE